MQNQFLLYGANGYTGKLIAKLSSTYNLQPILASRIEANIKPLADELQLSAVVGVRPWWSSPARTKPTVRRCVVFVPNGFAAEQSPTTQHTVPVNIF